MSHNISAIELKTLLASGKAVELIHVRQNIRLLGQSSTERHKLIEAIYLLPCGPGNCS